MPKIITKPTSLLDLKDHFHGAISIGPWTEEVFSLFQKLEVMKAVFIDPVLTNDLKKELLEKNDNQIDCIFFNTVFSNKDEDNVDFFVSNDRGNSSLKTPYRLREFYSNVSIEETVSVSTMRFDTLFEKYNLDKYWYNLIMIRANGAEKEVLEGCGNPLKEFGFVVVEVYNVHLFRNSWLVSDVNTYMKKLGFEKGFVCWNKAKNIKVRGDMLYVGQ